MPASETGNEKVKKLCEVLRKETLEPALAEAEEVLSKAKKESEEIIRAAKEKAKKILSDAEVDVEKRKKVFHASMQQGCRQTLEQLKEDIEQRLFSPALLSLLSKKTSEPKVLSELINAVVKAIQKEGVSTDLSAIIPSSVPAREVNEFLAKEVAAALREKSVSLGPMKGGIEVRMHDTKATIDVTASALQEMVEGYIREDLRKLLFGARVEDA